MEVWQPVAAVLVAILGIAGVIGGALGVLRSAALRDSLVLTNAANTELRAEIADLRIRLEDSEKKCAGELGKLKGELDLWRGEQLDDFKNALLTEVRKALEKS